MPPERMPREQSDATVIILAGGTSRRFGGADDDKLDATLGDTSLLAACLSSAPAWPTVIVGPQRDACVGFPGRPSLRWVRENPPLGGPAAAALAALPGIGTTWCAMLAGDTPRGGAALPRLLDVAAAGTSPLGDALSINSSPESSSTMRADGAIARVDGHVNPLLAVYRTEALRRCAESVDAASGLSMRRLIAPLQLIEVDIDAHLAADIDTEDDRRAYLARRIEPSDASPQRAESKGSRPADDGSD